MTSRWRGQGRRGDGQRWEGGRRLKSRLRATPRSPPARTGAPDRWRAGRALKLLRRGTSAPTLLPAGRGEPERAPVKRTHGAQRFLASPYPPRPASSVAPPLLGRRRGQGVRTPARVVSPFAPRAHHGGRQSARADFVAQPLAAISIAGATRQGLSGGRIASIDGDQRGDGPHPSHLAGVGGLWYSERRLRAAISRTTSEQ